MSNSDTASTANSSEADPASDSAKTGSANKGGADADGAHGEHDFIGHSIKGKFLHFEVPDYTNVKGTAQSQSSLARYKDVKDTYLRCGDASYEDKGAKSKWNPEADKLLQGHVTFKDDTRHRGTETDPGGTFKSDEATPPNEASARQAQSAGGPPKLYSTVNSKNGTGETNRNIAATALIPNYAGWRDHTDGHRITTTRGDKIEVVGGNYKLVSLGRGQGESAIEMSGGILDAWMEAPGNQTSVTWRECPTEETGSNQSKKSGWKVVEQTVKGHEVERFHGTQREEFYGDRLISVTGAPSGITPATIPVNATGPANDGEAAKYVNDGSTAAIGKVLGSVTTQAYPTRWDYSGGSPGTLQQPDIYESTWAKSVTTYTEVATTQMEYTRHMGVVKEDVHYDSGFYGHYIIGLGQVYNEYWAGAKHATIVGSDSSVFVGTSSWVGLANRFEMFVGFEEQLNIGGVLELKFPQQWTMGGSQMQAWIDKKTGYISEDEAALKKMEATLKTTRAALKRSNAALSTDILSLKNEIIGLRTNL
jgi:hypothetical protein